MLDFDAALELMKKYGYSSTSVHPYVYQNGDTIGICYSYYDDDYGVLERIKIFESTEEFEEFLKKLDWLRNNGKVYHVRMILDNYESINPKVIFLRNERIMVEGEMFDIDNFDMREKQREQMDDVSKVIYEAGDLLLVYNEIKGRQLQYLKNIVSLKNALRTKYFELQKEIDIYNKFNVERQLTLLPEVADIGINDMLEMAIKDKYNMFVTQRPTYEEAVDFLKEVWDLTKSLELNQKYYEAQKEETDIRNETKIVEAKIVLMKDLNDNLKPLFGVDLVSRFRKINKSFNLVSNSIAVESIQENISNVNRKYSVYDSLDLLYTSDYLREAIQNTNYADLAIKYSKEHKIEEVKSYKKPPNEVAASLSIQYRDKLTISEQAILVLYNNNKYRKLCNEILAIEDFEKMPIKKLVNRISKDRGFSKVKSECYDAVKKRIDDPINETIKKSLFANYDFSTFESFVTSLVNELVKLRNVNNKMILNGDVNMYIVINNTDEVAKRKFVMVTNDLNSLLNETKGTKSMIGITLLKENLPVLYSPYYFDVGDIYSKGASLQMAIKEMINFELLIETSDILINIDPVRTNVVRYYSEPKVVENISIVDDIKMNYKTKFCKFAFTSGIINVPVAQPVLNSEPSTELMKNGENTAGQMIVPQEVPVSANSVKQEGVGDVKKDEPSKPIQSNNVEENKEVKEAVKLDPQGTSVNKVLANGVSNNVSLEKNDSTKILDSSMLIEKKENKDVGKIVVSQNVVAPVKANEQKNSTVSVKTEPVKNDALKDAVKPVIQNKTATQATTSVKAPVTRPAVTSMQSNVTKVVSKQVASTSVQPQVKQSVNTNTATQIKPAASSSTLNKPVTNVASVQTKPATNSVVSKPVTSSILAPPVRQGASQVENKPVASVKPVTNTTTSEK